MKLAGVAAGCLAVLTAVPAWAGMEQAKVAIPSPIISFAAEYIAEHMSKPVVAYIAGFTAPPGKTMGHAGAIISGSAGTAQAKKEALEARGIRVGTNPTEAAQIAAERVRST